LIDGDTLRLAKEDGVKDFYISGNDLIDYVGNIKYTAKKIPNLSETENTVGLLKKIDKKTSDSIWQTINISNFISFKYPSDILRLQDKITADLIDSLRMIWNVPGEKKIALESVIKDSYVNVLLQTNIGNDGDFLVHDIQLKDLTFDERQFVKNYYLDGEKKSFEQRGVEIKKWYPVQLIEIGGEFCIRVKYIRESLLKKGDVMVILNCFPQSDREFVLSTSCRTDVFMKWENIFNSILNSVEIFYKN
jgi:hypothetical protein